MLGPTARLMGGQGYWLRALAVAALLLLPRSALAIAIAVHGPQLNDVADWEPKGLTPLIQSPHRVGSIEGQGGGWYFYRCGAAGLNALLEAYAKVDMEQHEVFVWPSLEEFKNTQGMALDDPPAVYNAVLDHPDGYSDFNNNDTLFPLRPRLTIYVSDPGELDKLRPVKLVQLQVKHRHLFRQRLRDYFARVPDDERDEVDALFH